MICSRDARASLLWTSSSKPCFPYSPCGRQGAPLFSFVRLGNDQSPGPLLLLSENVVPCQNHLQNSDNQMTPCAALARNAAGRAAMQLLPSAVRSRRSNTGKTAGGAGRRQNGASDSAKSTSVLPRNWV